jgi:flagellar hook-length control protein FliK
VAPQDIPLQAEWLAQRGGGRARVALYPPHLGRVDLEVRMRGAEVDVVIAVQEISAESPMAAQRDSLSDALASRDLRLASFDVVSDEAELSQRESERRGQDADEQRGAAVSGRATLRGLDRPETSPAARGSDNAIDVRI